MSLYKDASLVMIPSAYKDGKLYSIRPTDGSGDFTFSRGSNLAATRVDVNGLIEKGRENLLLQSNQFDTTWNKASSFLSSGQTGYDGTSDAWLLSKSAGYGRIEQPYTFSGLYAFSVYAKAGTLNWVALGANASTFSSGCFFDLTNGVVGSSGNAVVHKSIESVGNGWYRCIAILNNPTENTFRIYPADADNDTSGTSGNIYIQDAQLEAGLVATDYIETGASTAQAGILEDMPRLDYSGSCPALLLEPQRTNVVEYSEYFGAPNWSTYIYGGAGLVRDFGYASPEGKNNAYRFSYTAGSGSNGMLLTDNFSAIASVDYTLSVWMKGAVGGEKVRLCLMDTGSNGVAGTTFTLTNEWVLYTDTITNSAGTSRGFQFRMQNVIGVDNDQVVYVYGAQCEQGSYPTSYIPTYGSSVTRSNDYKQLDNLISLGLVSNDTFTYFAELNCENIIRDSSSLAIQIGSNAQRILFYNSSSTAARRFEIFIQDGTTQTYTLTADVSKICISVQPNLIKVYENGVNVLTTTQNLDLTSNSNYRMYGDNRAFSLKQDVFFPTALTDSECIALTTI